MTRDWRDRLQELVDRLVQDGGNPKAASLAAGLNETGIRDLLKKVDDPRIHTLQKVANYFQVSLAWLVEGAEDEQVPLLSWISAGNLAQTRSMSYQDEALEMLRWDLSEKGDWFALRVEGDSMDRISPPDSIIFVNRKDKRLVANACYVIADRESGEATYKRYRPDPARWEPVSTNPSHEPLYVSEDNQPQVIGRVRKSVLAM
ncbi:MAG: phage repressor protein [bacterium]|nr:phage repressor protein [bacterium]